MDFIGNLRTRDALRLHSFRHGNAGAIYNNPYRFPLVSRLFFPVAPPAILWGIGAIVINAVKGVGRARSHTHIRKKLLETIKPSIAYSYAPTTIRAVPRVFRVKAPIPHVVIRPVLGAMPAHAVGVGLAMLESLAAKAFSFLAPAAYYSSAPNVPCRIGASIPAITLAGPHGSAFAGLGLLHNIKPAEPLALNINSCAHGTMFRDVIGNVKRNGSVFRTYPINKGA